MFILLDLTKFSLESAVIQINYILWNIRWVELTEKFNLWYA